MRAVATVAMMVVTGAVSAPEPARQAMTKIVARIQRADYEDDRKALLSLAADLAPYTEEGPLASRAPYWRGFAMWRRAMNGFNDSADPKDLQSDLTEAVIAAAESNARAALALVPNWHYVRGILLPQIQAKAKETPPAGDPARKEASPADFDFLEGKWAIVYNNAQPGIPPDLRGTWTASKQADGRVLYDEFRILGPKGETFALGASYRVFDHVRKQWDCRYVQLILPGGEGSQRLAQWAEFTAWPEGSTLRVDQKGSRGSLRITYYDIAKDHFRWKADVSIDGGKTWYADQIRIEAKRAADSGPK